VQVHTNIEIYPQAALQMHKGKPLTSIVYSVIKESGKSF